MNWTTFIPTEAQSIANSTIIIKYLENFAVGLLNMQKMRPAVPPHLQFYQRRGKITRLPIAVKIFFQIGTLDKSHFVHRPLHQIGHIQETYAIAQEGEYGYFIGSIQHTGKITPLVERLCG